MPVFIGWSGVKSKTAAEALRSWLPYVFQTIRVWMSNSDLPAGTKWEEELRKALSEANFGIICVTKHNLHAPWILYEVGCLSEKLVCPVLLNLKPEDLKASPLDGLQAVSLNREGILKLVSAINSAITNPLSSEQLERSVEKWYPDLEKKLNKLPKDEQADSPRDDLQFFSKSLREYVCYHQGNLVEYLFLAGEAHKDLKRAFCNQPQNIDEIVQKRKFLICHLDEYLEDTTKKSFDEIQKMYSGRHIMPPRICLKANFGENKKNKEIIALARSTKVSYTSQYPVNKNTGFEHIQRYGRYYLCNNIPKDAKSGLYKNPRLIPKKVEQYEEPEISSESIDDKDWVKCWRSNGGTGKRGVVPHDCYKSTLIIPLTLWNNILAKKFIDKFKMKDVTGRTIFGYLCLDHISTDYFASCDIDSGYIYADILSLYLLVRFIFVDQSETYNKVITLLKTKGVSCDDF